MRNKIDLKIFTNSKFRSSFKLTKNNIKYIEDKTIPVIKKHAEEFVLKRISPKNPVNDGKQTPMKGHPVFIAQHATATCCRSCLKKWHGIDKDRALTAQEIDYVVAYIMGWIKKELIIRLNNIKSESKSK